MAASNNSTSTKMEQQSPVPIFEEAELQQLLKDEQLNYEAFIRPRQQYLGRHMNGRLPWPVRPVYQNVLTVLDYREKTCRYPEVRKLHTLREMLQSIAKLDNDINSVYSVINDIHLIVHNERTALEKKLAVLGNNPSKYEERITELKTTFEGIFRNLRETLKAQRDVLAMQEELRMSFMKELEQKSEKGGYYTAGYGARRRGSTSSR